MVCIIHFIFIFAEMSREPKVVVIDSADMAQKTGFPSTSIFDDSEDDMCGAVPDAADILKEKKPPGPIAIFFEKNKGWIITIGVLLLTVIALSLTVYFINIKCNNTVIEERDRANRLIGDLEAQSGTACSDRDRYCEEAQRLRSQLRELSEEYDKLLSTILILVTLILPCSLLFACNNKIDKENIWLIYLAIRGKKLKGGLMIMNFLII